MRKLLVQIKSALPVELQTYFQPVIYGRVGGLASIARDFWNRLLGLIARRSIVDGTGTAVEPIPADTITPSETVREAAQKLVSSSCNLLLLISDNQQVPIALVTLHDVLRAQARITEQILSQSFFALPG